MVIQTASIRTHNERRDNDLRTVVNYGDFNDPTWATGLATAKRRSCARISV
jgi:hypothetical protein